MDDTNVELATAYYLTDIERKGFSFIGIMKILITTFMDFGSTESDWRQNTVRILAKESAMIKKLKYFHAYQDAQAMRAVIDEDLSTLTRAQFDVRLKAYRGRRK